MHPCQQLQYYRESSLALRTFSSDVVAINQPALVSSSSGPIDTISSTDYGIARTEYLNHSGGATASMVLRLAQNNTSDTYRGRYLIVTVANFAHFELVMNWALSLIANGYNRFLVLCADLELYRRLRNETTFAGDNNTDPHSYN